MATITTPIVMMTLPGFICKDTSFDFFTNRPIYPFGSNTVNVVPLPGSLVTEITP